MQVHAHRPQTMMFEILEIRSENFVESSSYTICKKSLIKFYFQIGLGKAGESRSRARGAENSPGPPIKLSLYYRVNYEYYRLSKTMASS